MRSAVRFGAGLLTVALLAAACGDDGGKTGAATGTTSATASTAVATTTTAQPQAGGSLTYGVYSETAGLDPIVSRGSGVAGATEMAAIYDTLMRWNPSTGKYSPQTAASLDSSADSLEWTLKLKPNIKFSDGTAYDAAAVKFGLDRHRSGLPGAPACADIVACPSNTTSSTGYTILVKDIVVIDALTLKITLTEPWGGLPYMLSDEPGMIPSPTALKAACTDPTKAISQCSFNTNPVGAGPFVLESFKAKESITMKKNPTYWNGPVYLDTLVFKNQGDAGGTQSAENVKSDTFQAAILRNPLSIAIANDAKFSGYSNVQEGGAGLLFNVGLSVTCKSGAPAPLCTGKPDGVVETNPVTKSLKVRQAVAAAIDPQVINTRAFEGKGKPGSELFQKDYIWYPGVAGPKYDPEAAKKLVAEAKAEGWNGTIRLLYNNTPSGMATGQAVDTMLKAVGINSVLDTTKDTAGQIGQYSVNKDFDAAGIGIAVAGDDGAMPALGQNFKSTSASNRAGLKSVPMDAAIKEWTAAKTDAEKKSAAKKVQEVLNAEIPYLPYSAQEERVVWEPKVQGLSFNHSTVVFFDKAWIKK
jgi:peptide/nickel transport system substrate-binding protein